jgi:hypothetical protein
VDDQELRNAVVRKLLRKNVLGTHKKQIDTVVKWVAPTHSRGRCRRLIEVMLSDPDTPVERYGGGQRDNIRFASADGAVRYLQSNGGDIPFGWE